MLSVSPAFNAWAASPVAGEIWLFEALFASGTMRLATWGADVPYASFTWQGIGDILEVSPLEESEDGGRKKGSVKLSGRYISNIALAVGDPNEYKGKPLNIWVLPVDEHGAQLDVAVQRVAGVMDDVKITPSTADGGAQLDVVLEYYTSKQGALPDAAAFRVNDTTHQAKHPGELLFQYQAGIIGKPEPWLTVAFQRVDG